MAAYSFSLQIVSPDISCSELSKDINRVGSDKLYGIKSSKFCDVQDMLNDVMIIQKPRRSRTEKARKFIPSKKGNEFGD